MQKTTWKSYARKLAGFTAKLYSCSEIYSENGEKLSEKRQIPGQDKIHVLIDDVFVGQMRQSLENLERIDEIVSGNMFTALHQIKSYDLLLGGIVTLKELIEKAEQEG